MTFLPIVERELRVAARRGGTYWVRLGAALTALAIGGLVMLLPDVSRVPQRLGIFLFVALSIIAYVYSLLAGLRTADCLSEEKREGTLGLLFLTDLKGYDIVLGKLAATSLNVFYGMLAIFPVMAISLLVGGVTGSEFWRVVLASLNNLFFSLAVGMFCSAISRDERKGAMVGVVIILFFAGGLPLAGTLLKEWKRLPSVPSFFFIASPGYTAFMAFDYTFKTMTFNFFYKSALCVHLIGWGLLLASCFIVPRTWQDKTERGSDSGWRGLWQRWKFRVPEQRLAVRRHMLAANPFYWLAARDRMKMIFVWLLLGLVGFIWLWGLWKYPNDWKDEITYFWTGFFLNTVLKLWLGSEACRRFGTDRKSGALELLLSTPLSVREIVRGQLMALWKQFAGPAAVVLMADFLFLMGDRNDAEWVWICIAGICALVADLLALSWLGMWMGLRGRHANRAAAAAFVRVLVLPWMLFILLMITTAVFSAYSRSRLDLWFGAKGAVFAWLTIALMAAAFFGFRARHKLLTEFREVATQRFETRRSRRQRAEEIARLRPESPKSPQPQLG